MKVVGMEKRKVKSKRTGNEYDAATIYMEEPCKNGFGVRTESVFTTVERVDNRIQLGSEVRIVYNRFGSVESIDLVE